jgi:hypothetical protein
VVGRINFELISAAEAQKEMASLHHTGGLSPAGSVRASAREVAE